MEDIDALPLAGQLRVALCDFVSAAGTRRLLPTLFHVGTPGGDRITLPHDASFDAGLRADLVERVLDGLDGQAAERPVPWLTRTGDLTPTDADFAWFTAAREAFGRHALELPGFFVMTRYGWLNLANEDLIRWRRVRPRRADGSSRRRDQSPA
ncbi:hypothetical protein [Nocardioides pocheonensis]|uniref:Uncharacterized protein n=1 Tax=Nocardioides pocheonensis TaxID=661485 RepID=A0A3N0GUG8_9ACTN|nr:hypothetical protein [Nocardioides pocheonensis]RNM16051.1 hypothetical protein EFL26_07815 [Nocardioides pocheonensis]